MESVIKYKTIVFNAIKNSDKCLFGNLTDPFYLKIGENMDKGSSLLYLKCNLVSYFTGKSLEMADSFLSDQIKGCRSATVALK